MNFDPQKAAELTKKLWDMNNRGVHPMLGHEQQGRVPQDVLEGAHKAVTSWEKRDHKMFRPIQGPAQEGAGHVALLHAVQVEVVQPESLPENIIVSRARA